ncbi:MAG TPA: polysaccharide deacetylase family protein [Ferruginibacter sp.]|nr:polysaccharide deacetylase family protein [Ferruginibacter sp.]
MGKSLVLVFHKESNGLLFEKILVALKTRYRLVSIQELEHLLLEQKDLKNICHISFDDGHRSFYNAIFPVLKKHQVPASLFISPDVISTNSNYWFQEVHDYDEKIVKEILSSRLHISPEVISKTRFKMIFKTLSIQQIEEVMKIYQQRTGCGTKSPKNITTAQLHEIASSGLVTVGAHSLKHPILKNENDADCKHEISASIKKLEQLTGKPVKYFAFPNGLPGLDYGEREINFLRDNNISMAFSTEFDTLSRGINLLNIPRLSFDRMGLHPSNPLIFFSLNLGKHWINIKSLGKRSEKKERERIARLLKSRINF